MGTTKEFKDVVETFLQTYCQTLLIDDDFNLDSWDTGPRVSRFNAADTVRALSFAANNANNVLSVLLGDSFYFQATTRRERFYSLLSSIITRNSRQLQRVTGSGWMDELLLPAVAHCPKLVELYCNGTSQAYTAMICDRTNLQSITIDVRRSSEHSDEFLYFLSTCKQYHDRESKAMIAGTAVTEITVYQLTVKLVTHIARPHLTYLKLIEPNAAALKQFPQRLDLPHLVISTASRRDEGTDQLANLLRNQANRFPTLKQLDLRPRSNWDNGDADFEPSEAIQFDNCLSLPTVSSLTMTAVGVLNAPKLESLQISVDKPASLLAQCLQGAPALTSLRVDADRCDISDDDKLISAIASGTQRRDFCLFIVVVQDRFGNHCAA